jgi:hypothetical protein
MSVHVFKRLIALVLITDAHAANSSRFCDGVGAQVDEIDELSIFEGKQTCDGGFKVSIET